MKTIKRLICLVMGHKYKWVHRVGYRDFIVC